MAAAHLEFISTPMFESSVKKLLTEEDRRQLELLLLSNPFSGRIIERTGGVSEAPLCASEPP